MTILTHTTALVLARTLTVDTDTREITRAWGDLNKRDALVAHARAHLFTAYADVTSNREAGDLLGVGATMVSNLRKYVTLWAETGISDAGIAEAWGLVTRSTVGGWFAKWATPEGEALMALVKSATTDADKIALIRDTVPPTDAPKDPTGADLIALLKRAVAMAGAVTLTDDEDAEAGDLIGDLCDAIAREDALVDA